MKSLQYLAALILGLALIGGCKTQPKPEPSTQPTEDTISAAKAKYSALKGALVGEVVAVEDGLAAVSGIDAKALAKTDVVNFVDPATDQVVAAGTMQEVTPSGLVVIKFERTARPPRNGDLAVRLK